ncbi:MAG: hypothetical protein IT198_05760 [Acidimicrobiia bacterium]|nr:hypothetical protein [Acidimicrobiia bacterium]
MAKRPNPAKIRRRTAKTMEAKREFDAARDAARAERDGEPDEPKTDPLTDEKLLLFQRARETRVPLLDFCEIEARPPLIEAVAGGDADAVTAALGGKGSLGETVEKETKEGTVELGPMDVAIDGEDPDVIRALLDAGCDVGDHWLFTTWLHAYVSLYPAATALTYQLDTGEKATAVGQRAQLFKRHPNFVKVARLLVTAGADPHAYDAYEETTAAEKAAKYRMRELEDLFGPPQAVPEPAGASEASESATNAR